MARRLTTMLSALALALGMFAISAAPASANVVWTKALDCGVNYHCAMSSTTTGGVSYRLDGTIRVSWATSGAHSWSAIVSSGSHLGEMNTSGSFSAHSITCSCPPGTVCGA